MAVSRSIKDFFKRTEGTPDPKGPLSSTVSSTIISAANKAVGEVGKQQREPKSRGTYIKLTDEQKADIAKYALQNGISVAVKYYSKTLEKPIKESSVRMWISKYKSEYQKKRKTGETDLNITSLPSAKRGRPLMLGEQLDSQVQSYIRALRDEGGVVTVPETIAVATAIVETANRKLLLKHGGSVEITKNWAKSILYRMNFVKRRGGSTKKICVTNFPELKEQFLLDIMASVSMEEIPYDLVINWDQTGLHVVPGSKWTMEKKGSNRVAIAGIWMTSDKLQL